MKQLKNLRDENGKPIKRSTSNGFRMEYPIGSLRNSLLSKCCGYLAIRGYRNHRRSELWSAGHCYGAWIALIVLSDYALICSHDPGNRISQKYNAIRPDGKNLHKDFR